MHVIVLGSLRSYQQITKDIKLKFILNLKFVNFFEFIYRITWRINIILGSLSYFTWYITLLRI